MNLNWLAIVAATVVHQALGALWYGPMFGKAWMKSIGKTKEQIEQSDGPPLAKLIAISAVCSFVLAIALACVIRLCGEKGIGIGMGIGALTAIGFIATAVITNSLFEDRNKTTVGIYVGYQIFGCVLMGAILGGWR